MTPNSSAFEYIAVFTLLCPMVALSTLLLSKRSCTV